MLGLAVAWLASELVKRSPSARYTYGLRGSSILAALFNAVFLLVAVGAISWEAIQRIGSPEQVEGKIVMIVAAVGIIVNGITAWLFASGRKDDLNLRGAFLHMASDALVAAGVVAAGLVIILTGWLWLDPVVSLAINAIIVWGTWGLLRDAVKMSLAAVPPSIDPAEVRTFLSSRTGVAGGSVAKSISGRKATDVRRISDGNCLELLLDRGCGIEGETSLPLAHHVDHLDAGKNDGGTRLRLEAEHGPNAAFDAAMILLDTVVEVLALAEVDRVQRPAGTIPKPAFAVVGNDCLPICLAAVNDDATRSAMTFHRLA